MYSQSNTPLSSAAYGTCFASGSGARPTSAHRPERSRARSPRRSSSLRLRRCRRAGTSTGGCSTKYFAVVDEQPRLAVVDDHAGGLAFVDVGDGAANDGAAAAVGGFGGQRANRADRGQRRNGVLLRERSARARTEAADRQAHRRGDGERQRPEATKTSGTRHDWRIARIIASCGRASATRARAFSLVISGLGRKTYVHWQIDRSPSARYSSSTRQFM